jgi:hypothetical protein
MKVFYLPEYKTICKNITKNNSFWEDLHSETIIVIYEKNIDLSTIKNLIYFFTAFAIKVYNSDKFKKAYDVNYKRWGKVANVELNGLELSGETYNLDKENMLQWIEAETHDYKSDTEDEWYKKRLLSLYIEEGSERSLAKKLNIPRPTINKDLREYITYLRKKYDLTYQKP